MDRWTTVRSTSSARWCCKRPPIVCWLQPALAYKAFCTAQSFWLDDYALFMAVKADAGAGRPVPTGRTTLRMPRAGSHCRCQGSALAGQYRLLQGGAVLLLHPVERPESLCQRARASGWWAISPSTSARIPATCGPGPELFQTDGTDPPDAGGRLPSGCLCGRRSALGQSALRLAPPQGRQILPGGSAA